MLFLDFPDTSVVDFKLFSYEYQSSAVEQGAKSIVREIKQTVEILAHLLAVQTKTHYSGSRFCIIICIRQ